MIGQPRPVDAAECTVNHQQAIQHVLQFVSYASAHPEQLDATRFTRALRALLTFSQKGALSVH